MTTRWHNTLLAAALAMLGLIPSAYGQSVVTGRVVDAQTQQPIPGANITVAERGSGQGTAANPRGEYQLEGLSSGTYRLTASAVGYQPVTREVRLAAGEERQVDFALSAAPIGLNEVVVSATRSSEQIRSIPASVSVLTPTMLETQRSITSDLGAVLAQEVPGLAPSSGTLSNYGQTLRGRDISFLINGVPQTTPLRNASRWLRTIAPSAIERIEVVRGSSALYGYGATGGTVNVITKRPRSGPTRFRTEVQSQFSPADVGKSFGGRLQQQVTGHAGRVDYLGSAVYANRGYSFDAAGDLIPQDPQGQGGLANTTEYNLLGRLGVQLDSDQYLEGAASYFDVKQEMEYETAPGVPYQEKSAAVAVEDVRGEDPGTENLVAWLNYSHDDLLGSSLDARTYVQDYMTRFGFYAGHPDGGGQGYIDTRKYGVRVDAETPLGLLPEGRLNWGFDALRDRTAQPLVDGRTYVPPMLQRSGAAFAQVKTSLGSRIVLRGGLRYEAIGLEVDDYTTLYEPRAIEGGTLAYDALLPNVGAVLYLLSDVEAFASYGQGYSVADIGRVLRSPQAGMSSVEQLSPEAMKAESYELGMRGRAGHVSGEVAGFLSTSDLGATFGDLPELRIVRSPERVYGVEASLLANLRQDRLGAGATFTWLEGTRDADSNGSYETYLPGDRIPPLKVTSHVRATPVANWNVRLQGLYSGERNRFPGSSAFSEGAVDDYLIVDVISTYDVGAGTIKVAVQNLTDRFYFPTVAQWYNYGSGYTAAPGRRVRVGYVLTW